MDPRAKGILLEVEFKSLNKVKHDIVRKYGHMDVWTAPENEHENVAEYSGDIIDQLLLRRQRLNATSASCSNDLQAVYEKEFRLFESKPPADRSVNVLQWWKEQVDLVHLKDLAMEILCIMVSSAKSERVFSKSGRLSNP